MIYDRLENFNDYAAIDPEAWKLVEEFLESCGEKTPELGRHELNGKEVYVGIASYNTHLDNGVKLETHCNYIDIQLLLAGKEHIIYRDVEDAECLSEYNPEKDVAFFSKPDAGLALPLEVGNFAVFMPGEGHAPGIGSPDNTVIKAVFKIRAK